MRCCVPVWAWRLCVGVVLGSTGCVIRYGEGPASASVAAEDAVQRPVDFGPIERQIAEMVDKSEDVDARDRLEHAWSLAENMADVDPAAQYVVREYLLSVIEIETRARPTITPLQTRSLAGGFGGAGAVESAELAGPEPIVEVVVEAEVDLLDPMELEAEPDGEGEAVASVEPDPGPDVDLLMADAARLLKAHKADQAMQVLETCRALECWETVAPSWEMARDVHVFAAKEVLAVKFLELRGEAETEVQRTGLLEIQGALSSLRAAWPASAHATDIEAHMARVQKELELLPEEE